MQCTNWVHRQIASRLIAALLAISCFLTAPLAAQQPESRFQPPSFDDFVKQFFHSSPEEQAALERVQIDFRTERAFGKRSIAAYLQVLIGQRVSIERRGADHRYLETLVQRVQPLMKQNRRYRKISVYVARSGRFDARSFPGGHLVFHDGVFDWAESEAALVGIVAHELSHLDRGHQLRSLKQLQLLQSTFRRPASLSPETMFKNMKSMGKDFHPFHPADEALADLDSVAWTLRLGYDVRETIHLFARLTAENQRNGSLPSAVPSFLRTQPLNAERAAAVQSKYQDLVAERPGVELIVGRENLQRRSAVKLP